jgi:hypothetical protein
MNCEIIYKKDGIVTFINKATKKLVTDIICERLKRLEREMEKFPEGRIIATYENSELVLDITGYPQELTDRMKFAIRHPEVPRLNFQAN